MHRLTGKEIVRTIKLLRLIDATKGSLTNDMIAKSLGVSQPTVSLLMSKLDRLRIVDRIQRGQVLKGSNHQKYINEWLNLRITEIPMRHIAH
jgi:Mn-dependent DtxR family transcriptional regulator